MNDLLLIITIIVILANFIFAILSHLSLRKINSQSRSSKLDDKYIIENIIHLRTSQNVLYASITIMTFVLTFLGFNLQKSVSQEVKSEITKAARIDLDSLKMKSDNIGLLEYSAQQSNSDINKLRDQIKLFYDKIKQTPQKLYVVQGLQISEKKHRYLFSELRPIDGVIMPQFTQPPFVYWHAYQGESEIIGNLKVTNQGIETDGDFTNLDEKTYLIDLWIYVR